MNRVVADFLRGYLRRFLQSNDLNSRSSVLHELFGFRAGLCVSFDNSALEYKAANNLASWMCKNLCSDLDLKVRV